MSHNMPLARSANTRVLSIWPAALKAAWIKHNPMFKTTVDTGSAAELLPPDAS
jgi:hypothetical protein